MAMSQCMVAHMCWMPEKLSSNITVYGRLCSQTGRLLGVHTCRYRNSHEQGAVKVLQIEVPGYVRVHVLYSRYNYTMYTCFKEFMFYICSSSRSKGFHAIYSLSTPSEQSWF